MDWKSNLRRTQSLRSVSSSCDKPTWTEGRLRERIASVSQLVSRYQTTVEESASNPETPVNNDEAKTGLKEIKPSILKSNKTHLESPMKRNDARGLPRGDKSNLTRSKSVGSLQSSAGSIGALKALFESRGATQNKGRSPRAASLTSSPKAADIKPMLNGEGDEGEEPAPRKDARTDHVTRKVVDRTRAERRKTIGGIDFERIAASQDDEKRRSIADFRDSSVIQSKCISVKAMSALYLSKVVLQDSTRSLSKPEQDKSSQSGKRVQRTKMSEDSEQSKDDIPSLPSARHQQGPEDVSGAKLTQSMSLQLSKEKLHQQRAKCELKRLLKHTHPELKTLDGVVDEELAEVLSLETDGETGYEGEVLSRCLIFENCARTNKVSPYIPKKYVAEGTVERGDVSKSSAVQEHEDGSCTDKTIRPSHDPNRECEEDTVRIDVQATRRRFESQSVNTSAPFPKSSCQGKVSGDKKGAFQKQEFNLRRQDHLHTKSLDVINQPKKQGPCDPIIGQSIDHVVPTGDTPFGDDTRSILGPERIIKTSAALSQNNPFIPNKYRKRTFISAFITKPKPGTGRWGNSGPGES
ncbi:hypothetical protein CgunFtcFv8_015293 [Champsocephalus gunnari]|uniref:Uncharacterized protein n=1 Tax=Champsocephalus gunnari TaxID=52237 RepID=A0AAN8C6I7_CHAGU|nr:hypothetical protein CgunFtcFv8_015293 [Champsocephalus gunnari]